MLRRVESTAIPETRAVMTAIRGWFWSIGLFSAVINFLALTGSLFMLQVYDRVLASRSVPTLMALAIMALIAYVAQALLESVRSRMLVHVGADYENKLSPLVFRAVSGLALNGHSSSEAAQPVRDVDRVGGFLSGLGPVAFLDMPFMPLFLVGCFLLHPVLGWLAVLGGVLLLALAVVSELIAQHQTGKSIGLTQGRNSLIETCRRNAEVMTAMGFRNIMRTRWLNAQQEVAASSTRLADASAGVKSWAKVLRIALQTAMIGVGGYLAIHQEVSSGAIVAGSILMARALAPVELAISQWRAFVAARDSHFRLERLLTATDPGRGKTSLPAPSQVLAVDKLTVVAPGGTKPVVRGVGFELPAGSAVAIFGPSAAGKTSLARAVVGVWKPQSGDVRLDGAVIQQYPEDEIGRHIGYLPQDVELFDGTVAENIARFAPDSTSAEVVAAAQKAGAHDLIVRLPDGYDTRIGEGGTRLSGGQRQRIALARALFRDPFLVVLDEPNSNLDGSGDKALNEAIESVRARGGIVIVITHRTATINAVNFIAIMNEGRIEDFGVKDKMLPRLVKSTGGEQSERRSARSLHA